MFFLFEHLPGCTQSCEKNIAVPVSGTGEKLGNVTSVPSRGEISVNLTLLEKQRFESGLLSSFVRRGQLANVASTPC